MHVTYPPTIEANDLRIGIDDGEIDEQGNSEYENYWTKDSDRMRHLFYVQDLSPLAGLESLTIENMYGNLHLWPDQLTSILRNSPALRKLRLSVCNNAAIRCGRSIIHPFDPFWFFTGVCDAYGEAFQGDLTPAPLQLSSLSCGLGVYPTFEASLTKMVDLSSLEVVHFDTRDIEDDADTHFFVWDEFEVFLSPQKCPNLRRFSADRLGGSMYARLLELMENNPEYLHRLIVELEELDDEEVGFEALVLSGTEGGSQTTPTAWRENGTSMLCR